MNTHLQTIVLLSTGRTGTMFFAKIFREHFPGANAYHEADERSRLVNILTNIHLAGWASENLPLWAWRRAIQPALESCEKDFYIDSNNHLYGLVPRNPKLYPNLKVIHIVRDPRSYVRSHINWARHRKRSFIANYLVPFWQPNAFLMNEMDWISWARASQLERFAWIWEFKNRLIESVAETKTPYLRVKFEDFFGSPAPEQAFGRLLAFIGLSEITDLSSAFTQRVNPNQGRSFPSWEYWTPQQCRQVHALCGIRMQTYGYGNEPAWKQRLAQAPENA